MCSHDWCDIDEVSSQTKFIFRCWRCAAIVGFEFRGVELAVDVLDVGRASLQPFEVLGLVEQVLSIAQVGRAKRHKKRVFMAM